MKLTLTIVHESVGSFSTGSFQDIEGTYEPKFDYFLSSFWHLNRLLVRQVSLHQRSFLAFELRAILLYI